MIKRLLLAIVLGMLVSGNIAASCASTGNTGGYDDRQPYGEYDRPNRIPRSSDLVREGTGKLKWTADLDGTVYVYDVGADHIDYVTSVRRGQELVVHPDEDQVYIDGKVVFHENLRRDARHQVYFARERDAGGGSGGGDRLPAELRDARRVASGRGDIEFRARAAGRVFVYDATDRQVVYRSDLSRNQTLSVQPSKSIIRIEEARSNNRDSYRLNSRHDYEIYFKD